MLADLHPQQLPERWKARQEGWTGVSHCEPFTGVKGGLQQETFIAFFPWKGLYSDPEDSNARPWFHCTDLRNLHWSHSFPHGKCCLSGEC